LFLFSILAAKAIVSSVFKDALIAACNSASLVTVVLVPSAIVTEIGYFY
jgi:hypothetical protein